MRAATSEERLREHPPPDSAFRQTLALVSERVRAGEDLRFAVREFLDKFDLLPREDLRAGATTPPAELTSDARADALLGGLAEHLASVHGLGSHPRPFAALAHDARRSTHDARPLMDVRSTLADRPGEPCSR